MTQAKRAIFSIYPTVLVGYYALKTTSIKDFYFLKNVNFFDYLRLSVHYFNA